MKPLIAIVLAFVAGHAWAAPYIEGTPLAGQVLESIDAGTYTYLRLKTDNGEVWAAIMATKIADGTQIVIQDPMLMTQFESKALHKTFDKIYFGSVVNVVPAPSAAHMSAHGEAAAAADVPVGKIAKATGTDARTVAEVFAQKAKLNGKTVVVRGKVVKYSSGIMDKNWLHLRDGSGSATDKTNDLLVTTQQTAVVGDVVVVQGMVRTSVDYGAGYAYPVVLENATVTKGAATDKAKTAQRSPAESPAG